MSVSGNFIGDYEPQGAIVVWGKKTGSAIAKGDLCNLSSGSWQTCPTGATTGPFAVAIKAAAAADTKVQLILYGIVMVTADGTITINNPICGPTSTAGRVGQTATPAGTGCAGRYLNHQNEGDGTTVETNAAAGDVIRIIIGGPF
jgi:hypothetical protein